VRGRAGWDCSSRLGTGCYDRAMASLRLSLALCTVSALGLSLGLSLGPSLGPSLGLGGLALAAEPSLEAPEDELLISDGTITENCQWPTTVLLQNGGALCSGTLIHPEIVSTAAHCVDDDDFPAEIIFGESGVQADRRVKVDHCRQNPAYIEDTVGGDDFAYCKLAAPVYDIPITPPVYGCETSILVPGRAATMVGFGNNEGESGAGFKRWGESVIQTVVTQSSSVVVVGEVGNAACGGDSGGPAFVQYPDGSWHTFGIVSGGPPCGAGPDTYVLLHRAVPWIEETSGVDVTPCHDVDGTWNPGPDCQRFAVDTLDSEVEWVDWCETPRSGASATCGDPFDADPDEQAPSVQITAPEDGTLYPEPNVPIDIVIDASDEGHGVREVRLEVNGEFVTTDEHAPWVFSGASFPKGGWTLVAVAEDWAGNIAESEPVRIGVDAELPPIGGEEGGEAGEAGEAGETGGGAAEDGEGCSCASGRSGGAWGGTGLLGLLGLLGLSLRRRSEG